MINVWPLKSNPYKVQTTAIERAWGRRGYGYFCEMGIGKTAITLAEITRLFMYEEIDLAVVLCPNSVKPVWATEAEKHGADCSVTVWPDRIDVGAGQNHLFIMNYEALLGRGGDYLQVLVSAQHGTYLALDESIYIKNPRAKRTRKAMGLADRCKYVRVLSGAPIVQSPLDIWAQLQAIGCDEINENPYAFRNRYCAMGGWQGKQIVGAKNEDRLKEIIANWGFVAKKKDWLDLPDQIYPEPLTYTIEKDQATAYKNMLDNFMLELEEGVITAPMAITQMTKLQQIASGFIIDEEGRDRTLVEPAKNPKIQLVESILEEIEGKLIIFTHFVYSTKLVSDWFNCPHIRGGMTKDQINDNMAEFNEGEARVIVAQLQSAKYGLTLLGTESQPCCTSFYYENTFSLDARIQSEGRNHRHGQHFPVTYLDAVGSPIEGRVIRALQKKLGLVEAIMGIEK